MINLTKRQEKIKKIGVCKPVPPAGSGEREVEENRPTVSTIKVKTHSKIPHLSQSLHLWGKLVCDNLDLVLGRFIDHLDEPQGVISKAGHIGHGKGSVVWLGTSVSKDNNLDKCLNYKWNIPGVVDLYRHYLCFRKYIYNFQEREMFARIYTLLVCDAKNNKNEMKRILLGETSNRKLSVSFLT